MDMGGMRASGRSYGMEESECRGGGARFMQEKRDD